MLLQQFLKRPARSADQWRMNEPDRIEVTNTRERASADRGFSLVEMLIVIVVLGILATVTVLAVRGTTDNAETQACQAEIKNLNTMVEAHFVRTGGRTIVPTGATDDRFEITLVDAQIMRAVSTNFDIDADGEITPAAGGICD
jgi:prepilin-type N-terminal cleavage/methylation domain-containing protein